MVRRLLGSNIAHPFMISWRRQRNIATVERTGHQIFGLTMHSEDTIAEIQWLQRIFALPDNRPLRMCDREACKSKT
jgi:hypothetical protein